MTGRVPIFPVNRGKEKDAKADDTTARTTKPASPMMLQRSPATKRSINMTSDSGLICQETDDARHLQEVLDALHQMQPPPRLLRSPDAREAFARAMRQRPDRLGSLLVGYHRQQALDAAALQAEQARLVRHWPHPLKNDGKVRVMSRTAHGPAASRHALCWRVRWPGAVRHLRSLHPGVGFGGEPVSRNVGLFGRGPGRVGRQRRGVGHENGADDCLPLCRTGQAGAAGQSRRV